MNPGETHDDLLFQNSEDSVEEEDSVAMFSSLSPPFQEDIMEHTTLKLSFDEKQARIRHLLQAKESDGLTSIDIADRFNHVLENTSAFLVELLNDVPCLLETEPASAAGRLRGAVQVLQLLAPRMMEAGAELTCALYSLPGCGAQILRDVFTHCRDSDSVYGEHLASAESELKELFGSGHQLQRAYLDLMLNRLTVDTDEEGEVTAIVEALHTNIEIGEVVIALDVRTMAEQWKGFTALCEKYAAVLARRGGVPARCVDSLADVVLANLRSCLTGELDQKSLQRSLKVTSFLMKIIIKMCQIFKYHVTQDYTQIVKLLITIKGYSEVYLRSMNKPEALVQQVSSHVIVAAEPLLSELLDDRSFALAVMSSDGAGEGDNLLLGRLLLLASVSESLLARDEPALRQVWLGTTPQDNIVCSVLGVMPRCHVWLNYGLKLECRAGGACGLYELVLGRASALAATCDAGQHAAALAGALAALLRADCWAAALAADLCVALARYSPADLCVQQINHLIEVYKMLMSKDCASEFPQSVYLSATIRRLFNTLPEDGRLLLLEAYPILRDAGNLVVWEAIGVRHLPDAQAAAESSGVFTGLRYHLERWCSGQNCDEGDLRELLEHLMLAATCVPVDVPADQLVQLWLKCYAAGEMRALLDGAVEAGGGWFGDCVLALSELTGECCRAGLFTNVQLIQILDVLASIIALPSSALKFAAMKVLSGLSYKMDDNAHTSPLRSLVTRLFQKLLTDEESIVMTKALEVFNLFCHNSNQESIILDVVANKSIKESVIHFIKDGELKTKSKLSWIEQLRLTSNMKFIHKCQNFESNVATQEDCISENFETPDVDSLFDASDIEYESESKRIKLNHDEVNSILCRLEHDAGLLEGMKEDVSSKECLRLEQLINRLKIIIPS